MFGCKHKKMNWYEFTTSYARGCCKKCNKGFIIAPEWVELWIDKVLSK